MFTKRIKKFMAMAFLTAAIAGCSAIDEPVSSLDDGISKMQSLSVGVPYNTQRTIPTDDPMYPTLLAGVDTTIGTNFRIVEVADAKVFDEGFTLGFNNSSIWLGSILNATRLGESKFDELVFDRKPYNFSISLKGYGQVRATSDGSRSSFEQNLSDLLMPEITKAQAGIADYTYESVYSKEDMYFKLGVGLGLEVSSVKVKLDGLFNFNNTSIKSRILVKYKQVYYSATMDKPSKPSKLFTEGMQFSQFQAKVSGNVSPVYISTIQYGRMGYLAIESTSDEDVTMAALKASVNVGSFGGNLDVSSAMSNAINTASIKVVMVGGSLTSMAAISGGLDGFINWIRTASDTSSITAGVPVAFEMTYLKDNRMAEVYKMNKQYATIWWSTNTNVAGGSTNTNVVSAANFSLLILSSSDGYLGNGGKIQIMYYSKDGNLINSVEKIVNSYSRAISISQDIKIDNPENYMIVQYDLVTIPTFGPSVSHSANYIVYCQELLDNPYKYKKHIYEEGVVEILPK